MISVILIDFELGIRTNASLDERRAALLDDSVAFGISCATGAFIQFILCAIGVDLVNKSALRQVRFFHIFSICIFTRVLFPVDQ